MDGRAHCRQQDQRPSTVREECGAYVCQAPTQVHRVSAHLVRTVHDQAFWTSQFRVFGCERRPSGHREAGHEQYAANSSNALVAADSDGPIPVERQARTNPDQVWLRERDVPGTPPATGIHSRRPQGTESHVDHVEQRCLEAQIDAVPDRQNMTCRRQLSLLSRPIRRSPRYARMGLGNWPCAAPTDGS